MRALARIIKCLDSGKGNREALNSIYFSLGVKLIEKNSLTEILPIWTHVLVSRSSIILKHYSLYQKKLYIPDI